MPANLTLNSVANTLADISVTGIVGSIAQGGWVDGLEGDPSTFLAQCFVLVNDRVPPGSLFPGTSFPYKRLQVQPTSGDTAAVILHYSAEGGGTPSAYTIGSRAYEASIQTKNIMATGEPIVLEWRQNPADATSYGVKISPVTIAPITIREVSIEGIAYGAPNYLKYEGFHNYVNAEQWRGLPPGYWRINGGGILASIYAGTYGFSLSAVTRNIIDWSESQDVVDPRSGQRLPVSDADTQAVLNAPYSQGTIKKVNGRTRWGQFPVTSFTALFGFGGIGGNEVPANRLTAPPPDMSGIPSRT